MIFDNFFDQCQVETTDFDKQFASSRPDWLLLKDKYEKVNLSNNGTIPKIIHFMWIGSDLPKIYDGNIKDWKNKNPNFEVVVWDDKAVNEFLQGRKLEQIFHSSNNMGIKSDVARYEILKQYGGLYLDTDFICLSSEFEFIHDNLSFYSCCSFEKKLNIFNGMLAAEPNHPIINLCIENCDLSRCQSIACESTRVLYQTGPYLFTRCIVTYLYNTHRDNEVVFPAQYFYPFPATMRHDRSQEVVEKFIKPHSLACHLWHCSWQPDSMFYKGGQNDN